jgi:hypothetical protein
MVWTLTAVAVMKSISLEMLIMLSLNRIIITLLEGLMLLSIFWICQEQKNPCVCFRSARSYGSSLVELARSGILRAVIELPRVYNANARNLYILDSYGENSGDVFL